MGHVPHGAWREACCSINGWEVNAECRAAGRFSWGAATPLVPGEAPNSEGSDRPTSAILFFNCEVADEIN